MVGIGPGGEDQITPRALKAIEEADVIIGYSTYIKLIEEFIIPAGEILSSGMRREVDRAKLAVEKALEGKNVAVVSSGDPGIYGMAGVVIPLAKKKGVEVAVVAGLTAAGAGAALLGAPLMHDFATISLSDLLTPWEKIIDRVEKAAQADFVLVIYNPKSQGRQWQIEEVQNIVLKHRSDKTPVGIARNVGRLGEEGIVATLKNFTDHHIDMFSTVVIGNSESYTLEGEIVTPRGYRKC